MAETCGSLLTLGDLAVAGTEIMEVVGGEGMEEAVGTTAGVVEVTLVTDIVAPEALVVTEVVTDAGLGVTPGTEETPGRKEATPGEGQDQRAGADPARYFKSEDQINSFCFFANCNSNYKTVWLLSTSFNN